MPQIKIELRNGETLKVEAEGRCYRDSNGAGEQFEVVEELVCYWPQGRRTREIDPSFYNVDAAEEALWKYYF